MQKMYEAAEAVVKRSYLDENATQDIAALLRFFAKGPVVVLCLGSDKSIYDSFGPLCGTYLKQSCPEALVLGTLKEPVHAANAAYYLDRISYAYPSHCIIAVDCALSSRCALGSIIAKNAPLHLGRGEESALRLAGDISIAGVTHNINETAVFGETRLSTVCDMALCAANALKLAFY